MIKFGPKAKIIFFGIGCVIIVFGWVSVFLNVKGGVEEIPLENDVTQAIPEDDKQDEIVKEIDFPTGKEENSNDESDVLIDAPQIVQEETGPITILFPPMYEKESIERLFQIIEDQSGVAAKAKQPNTRSQYTTLVERFIQSKSSTIDIIIAPSDHRESYAERGMSFALPEGLQRFYHEGFFKHMYTDSPTIVPVGIDPLVLFTRENEHIIETTRDLLSADVRFGLGLSKKDFNDLDKKQTPFADANSIIDALIEESLNRTMIEWILLFVNNNQRDGDKEGANVTIGFLSNTERYEVFTATQLLPWSSLRNYPARGRGMIINDNSVKKSLIEEWVGGFVTVSVETNTVPYPEGLIGATHSVMQRQFLQAFTAPLQKIRNTKEFITGTVETFDDIIYTQTFKDAVSGEIDQKTLLQRISTKVE